MQILAPTQEKNIRIASRDAEHTVTAPVTKPMTIVKAAEIVAVKPANMLMSPQKNIMGASNMKAIIRHHTPWRMELTLCCPFRRVSYHAARGYPQSILPSPSTWQSCPLPASPQNCENFCGLSSFCYLEFCFPIGHDHENDQHYQADYHPYPGWNRGYRELGIIRPGAFVAIVIYYLDPPVVGPLG